MAAQRAHALNIDTFERLRASKGYSEEELSAKAGVSVDTITRALNGRRLLLSRIARLADALSVTAEILIASSPPDLHSTERKFEGPGHEFQLSITGRFTTSEQARSLTAIATQLIRHCHDQGIAISQHSLATQPEERDGYYRRLAVLCGHYISCKPRYDCPSEVAFEWVTPKGALYRFIPVAVRLSKFQSLVNAIALSNREQSDDNPNHFCLGDFPPYGELLHTFGTCADPKLLQISRVVPFPYDRQPIYNILSDSNLIARWSPEAESATLACISNGSVITMGDVLYPEVDAYWRRLGFTSRDTDERNRTNSAISYPVRRDLVSTFPLRYLSLSNARSMSTMTGRIHNFKWPSLDVFPDSTGAM